MLLERTTLELFPTRLTTFRIATEPLNRALSELVLARSKTVPTVARGERCGWQSGNDFLSWSPAANQLGKLLADAVMSAHDVSLESINLFAWANLFSRGVYFNPHSHADAAWSGAYYVDAGDSGPDAGGLLMFRDPRAGAGMVMSDANAFDSACTYEVAPRTGMLVIFPAWLVHWVTPYQSDRPRISVSFNAR